jgi:hypothetical protein
VNFFRQFLYMVPVLIAAPALAEESGASFDMSLFGIPLGEVAMQRHLVDGAYEAEAHFATVGAVGVLARLFFDISASGTLHGERPQAAFYTEEMDTGRRQTNAEVAFAPDDTRLDPMSALYAGLGDRPVEHGCAFDREVFDGERTHRLVITPQSHDGDTLVCSGSYTRVAGYPAWQIRWHKGYTFTIFYRVVGEVLAVESARADSYLGKVRLERRQP